MLLVLRKVGTEYSVFIFILHYGRASTPNWNIPSLDYFVEFLIQEQYKLVQMGVLQIYKSLTLLVTYSNNAQKRGKHKGKETKNTD